MIHRIILNCCFYFFYCGQIGAGISRNAALDSLDKCAGNIAEFTDCKNDLKETLKANGLKDTSHLNLKYHSGALITWSPVTRTEFEAYCGFATKIDECLNIPGVREACPDETITKLVEMFLYFCQPERKDEFLSSMECVWRIDTWYDVDRCVRAALEIANIKTGLKSEAGLLCRTYAAALDCSKKDIVKDCGQIPFDYMYKAAATMLQASDPKCNIDAETENETMKKL